MIRHPMGLGHPVTQQVAHHAKNHAKDHAKETPVKETPVKETPVKETCCSGRYVCIGWLGLVGSFKS